MWGKECAHGPTFKVSAQVQGAEAEGSGRTGSIHARGATCWLLAVTRPSPQAGTDPKRKASVPGHQKRDEGVSAECAGKQSAREGEGAEVPSHGCWGAGSPGLMATPHTSPTPLPPEAASAQLFFFPSSLKYRRARVVVLQLLERLLSSAPLGGAGGPRSPQDGHGGTLSASRGSRADSALQVP